MSDDEVMKFEITDFDLDNEFNTHRPGGRKNKKEHQIYGQPQKLLPNTTPITSLGLQSFEKIVV